MIFEVFLLLILLSMGFIIARLSINYDNDINKRIYYEKGLEDLLSEAEQFIDINAVDLDISENNKKYIDDKIKELKRLYLDE